FSKNAYHFTGPLHYQGREHQSLPRRFWGMATGQLRPILEHLRHLVGASSAAPLTDGQLLTDFISHRDEAAFAALLLRHGPMVFGVCRRVLHNTQDVDDAFQATFLVLLRQADAMVKERSIGSWLYGLAYRIAVRARAQVHQRPTRKRRLTAWA